MAQVGRMNSLEVLRKADHGIYLDAGDLGEILLPIKEVNPATEIGDFVLVFIYYDTDDRIIASTTKPLGEVGTFANLKVVDTNKVGAFLDWGLQKDLLVPFQEQKAPLHKGQRYTVYIYFDKVSQRIVASTKLDKFISESPPPFKEGENVKLLIVGKTDLGYKAIIENTHWGLIFADTVFKPPRIGRPVRGFIKKIRPDGKIDLSLREAGNLHLDAASKKVMDALKKGDGFLRMTDKTPPEEIYEMFGFSKKVFKRTLGGLYKKRLIKIEPKGIRLLKD